MRLRCYDALLDHYLPRERVLFTTFHGWMRYGGPREAVLHAEGGADAISVSARDRQTTGPLLAAVELALWREGRLERRDEITSVA